MKMISPAAFIFLLHCIGLGFAASGHALFGMGYLSGFLVESIGGGFCFFAVYLTVKNWKDL